MTANVGQLTTDELREIIGAVVEEKLKEILGDPDDGLELSLEVRERLQQQKETVERGERGEDLSEVAKRLGVS
jgi:CO dehydrogenase/acetyl-CoA synthase alpha subunit